METQELRTWIELNREHISHNYEIFRGLVAPETKLMSVVKSNAYGHGLIDFSKEMVACGIDWLGVDSVVEGLKLRKEGITVPILVLGYTLPSRVKEAIDANIHLSVSSFDTLHAYNEILSVNNGSIKIHIKVDTGLHRQGFYLEDSEKLISFLKEHEVTFKVEGLYTHFAKAKNPEDRTYTDQQIEIFEKWREHFNKAGFTYVSHASATAGLFLYPQAHFDIVRVGAGFYGIWPAAEVEHFLKSHIDLKPVLTWKTIIVEKKKIKEGEGVGYDLADIVSRDSVIALCPIGYWHGFPRSLSQKGEVLVRGKKARVLGRVAMDMIIIDITDIPDAIVTDEVVMIGTQGAETISAFDMAQTAGTTSYEIVTRINPLIKKLIV